MTTKPIKNKPNKILFRFEKSNILDLYSGTGSFGLECVSRKASKVIFIEKEKEAIKILEKNIKKLKLRKKTKIFFDDVFDLVEKQNIFNSQFQLIFCDPPFKDTNIDKIVLLCNLISARIMPEAMARCFQATPDF